MTNAATKLEVKVTVDLPGPRFRGLKQHGVVYARLTDVTTFLMETAEAFDKAHANNDIGKSFRACCAAIVEADTLEAETMRAEDGWKSYVEAKRAS